MFENVLSWGKVVGQFVGVVADSAGDEDQNPEIMPLQGKVTFTARAHTALISSPVPLTLFMSTPIVGELDSSGFLTLNGQHGIVLPATDSQVSPTGFTYTVRFDLTLNGKPITHGPLTITVPAASYAAPIDLTTVTPVTSTNGVPVTQGTGVQSVSMDGADLVVQYTNGSSQRVPITGTVADSAAISALETRVEEIDTDLGGVVAELTYPQALTIGPAPGVDIDATDMIRDLIASLNGQPGTVRLPAGEYYLGGGSTPDGVGFWLASGQRIEGAGSSRETNGRTVLYVDDQTQGMGHIFRSDRTTGASITGLTFENRCTSLADVSFRDPVFFRSCSDFDLSYNTSTPTNLGFQFDANIRAEADTPVDSWGRNGVIRECSFTALTEFHSTHNMRVEDCEWNIDRGQVRPEWLRGEKQTAFKFSGNWGLMREAVMRNCKITVRGSGERFEAFELFRCPDVLIDGLTYVGDRPDNPSMVQIATTKPEYGIIEGQMVAHFRNCDFGNMNIALFENTALRGINCRWNNTVGTIFNAIVDNYETAQKQATTIHPTEVTLNDCVFRGGGRYIIADGDGAGLYKFTNCEFEYDNGVNLVSIDIVGMTKRATFTNCRIHLKNVSSGGTAVFYVRQIKALDLDRLMVTLGPNVIPKGEVVWLGGASGVIRYSTPSLPDSITQMIYRESNFTGTVTTY